MANKYFVTGATGAIGSALLPLLLAEPDSLIWALMRADGGEHLAKRLEELIAFWELDQAQAQDARSRIIALQGDTDRNRFALTDEVYSEVARQCTHIIHCAGVVRMNLPLATARQHALGAAKNIVALAIACLESGTLRKVEYLSTVGVGGKMPGLVPETWLTQPREYHNTYEQSKAEAEDYIREQIERHHLPITVHRPSMVVGHSKTGKIIHYQIFYHICEFLAGRRTFGILPDLGEVKLDTVAVDYVAAAIKYSAERQDSIGKIFHLCSANHAIPLTELQKLVRLTFKENGIKIPMIVCLPIAVFNRLIYLIAPFLNEKMSRSVKTFPFFLDYLSDEQAFDNSLTKQYLSVFPDVDHNQLKITLGRYLQRL